VQITQDGGETWREVYGGENGARSVDCSSTQNCFVIDNQGQLQHWDGTNLTRQTVADEFSLRGISCAPDGKCFIVGAFNDPNLPAQNSANNLNISIGLVFLAGVISFLSPCVLPVLPGYLTYLAARSSGQDVTGSRSQVLFHGIAFVAGSASCSSRWRNRPAIGQSLYGYKEWITRIGGVLIVFFGLQMSGWLRVPFLEMEIRKQTEANPRLGYISSLLMGVFFSAGWTPCVGPTLGLVLTLAGTEASIAKGVLLLALYSLGLGLPFIITALAMDRRTLDAAHGKRNTLRHTCHRYTFGWRGDVVDSWQTQFPRRNFPWACHLHLTETRFIPRPKRVRLTTAFSFLTIDPKITLSLAGEKFYS
jgi:cytochrome c-type biogenesis protein